MRKKVIIISAGLFVVLSIIAVILAIQKNTTQQTIPGNNLTPPKTSDFESTIKKQPDVAAALPSTFTILSTSSPTTGWYIVKVNTNTGSTNTSSVVMKQNDDSSLSIIAGPGTSFPLSLMRANNVPQVVMDSLLVYDDQQ